LERANISEPTYKFIHEDPDFIFERRNKIAVKGKGEMQSYFLQFGNLAVVQNLEGGAAVQLCASHLAPSKLLSVNFFSSRRSCIARGGISLRSTR